METNSRFSKDIESKDWFNLFTKPEIELARAFFGMNTDKKILLLDLGCGTGYRSSIFHVISNARIVGVDINIDQLRIANNCHYPDSEFILGDIEKIPFKDSTFDAIFSYSVLQYVEWRSVVRKCNQLLKPNGKAVFIENLEGSPIAKVYRVLHKYLGWNYTVHQTPKNHIKIEELDYFKSIFFKTKFTHFHLLTPASLIVPAIKKGFYGKPMSVKSVGSYQKLSKIDDWLINKVPYLTNYCWHVVICAEK